MTDEMERKLRILETFGFQGQDPTVVSTILDLHRFDAPDKFRSKVFKNEELRINSHKANVKKNRGPDYHRNNKSTDSLQNFNCDDFDKKPYETPDPFIPYPHKSKDVLPDGFIRDCPGVYDKIINRYKKWFSDRNPMINYGQPIDNEMKVNDS